TIRQGPHQGAQKSTNTGPLACTTCWSNVASVTATGCAIDFAPFLFKAAATKRWQQSTPESYSVHYFQRRFSLPIPDSRRTNGRSCCDTLCRYGHGWKES